MTLWRPCEHQSFDISGRDQVRTVSRVAVCCRPVAAIRRIEELSKIIKMTDSFVRQTITSIRRLLCDATASLCYFDSAVFAAMCQS